MCPSSHRTAGDFLSTPPGMPCLRFCLCFYFQLFMAGDALAGRVHKLSRQIAQMRALANTYRTILLLLGLVLVIRLLPEWHPGSLTVFGIYLGLALASALAPVGLPTPVGTLRLSFLFVLVGLTQVSPQEAMLIAAVASFAESLYPRRAEWEWTDVGARVAGAAIAAVAAQGAYQWVLTLLPAAPGAALPLAATVYFLISSFALASVASLRERSSLREIWHRRFLWSLPYYLSGAALAALFPAIHQLEAWRAVCLLLPVFFLVWRAYAVQIQRLLEEERHAQELGQLQFRMIEALSRTLEARDDNERGHLQRITSYAEELGRCLGLNPQQIADLRSAAMLHDIGKLAVPEHVLFKTDRLTEAELAQLQMHSEVGAEILERSNFPPAVADIVRAHHEKWDGSGYPRQLRGTDIPLGARILAAVDYLDALASDRPFKRALPLEQAVDELVKLRGVKFDPDVVDQVVRNYRSIERAIRSQPLPEPETGSKAPGGFFDAIAAARREEKVVGELLDVIGSSLNLKDTLTALNRRLLPDMPHETLVFYLLRDGELKAEEIVGEKYGLFSSLSIAMGAGITGRAAETRTAIVNGDPAAEAAHTGLRVYASALAVPLETASGVIGVLTLYNRAPSAFTPIHERLLLAIAPRLATAAEHSLQFRQAENMAAYDFLTGLPNAGSLMVRLNESVARCQRTGESLTVLVCDLDGFKQVNDRFGHLSGNRVLQEVAHRLKEQIREYDFVARMGGDEFVVLLPGLNPETVRTRKQKFGEIVETVGREVTGEDILAISIGEAQFPGDERTPEGLLALADDRMYRTKQENKLLRPRGAKPTAHDWLTQAHAGN